MRQPNILWICTDQQRFDTLGCYGNPWVHTPNLDRLAAGGTLFERAFCQNPLCTPSRASFLTGRYPRTTRARQNGQSIPADEVLVTKLLANAGYSCGLAGKLHLSACAPTACPDREHRIDDGYSTFHWSHHPDGDWPSAEYNQWLRAQGVRFERKPFRGSSYVQTSVAPEYHQTRWCADRTIDFIEAQASTDSRGCFH
jgi:arylsulfatase A-like enzyme